MMLIVTNVYLDATYQVWIPFESLVLVCFLITRLITIRLQVRLFGSELLFTPIQDIIAFPLQMQCFQMPFFLYLLSFRRKALKLYTVLQVKELLARFLLAEERRAGRYPGWTVVIIYVSVFILYHTVLIDHDMDPNARFV